MAEKRVCFLMGSIALSGGTYVIFQHAGFLAQHGYDVTLAVMEPFSDTTASWHDLAETLHFISMDEAATQTYDLVVATWWKTALELPRFSAPRHAYFVQSIESRFYSEAEKPLRALVDATYQLPVTYVTEATWIVDHLERDFGQKATLVRNGIRKDIYCENGPQIAPRVEGKPRVLIEGHFNVPFKNTALALKLARKAGAGDIWVLTGSPVRRIPGVSRLFSRVPIQETPSIYRSCDILVKLSTVEGMFGPPLEMFHCGGTAVVFDVSGHDEYIQADKNAVVVRGRDTDEVVQELKRLLRDPDRLAKLKAAAVQTAEEWPSWDVSSTGFAAWIEIALHAPMSDVEDIERIVNDAMQVFQAEEIQRLQDNRSIEWGYKVTSLMRRLPKGLQDRIKKMRAAVEVLSPSRKVL